LEYLPVEECSLKDCSVYEADGNFLASTEVDGAEINILQIL